MMQVNRSQVDGQCLESIYPPQTFQKEQHRLMDNQYVVQYIVQELYHPS